MYTVFQAAIHTFTGELIIFTSSQLCEKHQIIFIIIIRPHSIAMAINSDHTGEATYKHHTVRRLNRTYIRGTLSWVVSMNGFRAENV